MPHGIARRSQHRWMWILALAVCGLAIEGSWALSLDGSGTVTDWGVTPFVQTGTSP